MWILASTWTRTARSSTCERSASHTAWVSPDGVKASNVLLSDCLGLANLTIIGTIQHFADPNWPEMQTRQFWHASLTDVESNPRPSQPSNSSSTVIIRISRSSMPGPALSILHSAPKTCTCVSSHPVQRLTLPCGLCADRIASTRGS